MSKAERSEPHGGAEPPSEVSTNVPTKVSNKDFFSAAEPPGRSQRRHDGHDERDEQDRQDSSQLRDAKPAHPEQRNQHNDTGRVEACFKWHNRAPRDER